MLRSVPWRGWRRRAEAAEVAMGVAAHQARAQEALQLLQQEEAAAAQEEEAQAARSRRRGGNNKNKRQQVWGGAYS